MPVRTLAMLAVLAAIATSISALAMTVTPIHVEMTSAGPASRTRISVVNDSNTALPVEITIRRVTLNEAGVATTSDIGEEFFVMPQQAMIAPGATQNFRIQWLGEPLIEKSGSYLLYVNQLPVKLPKRERALQIVTAMGVMINVAPPRGDPSLQVVATGVIADKQGRRHPTITVQNSSKIHALFPQATIHLSSGNWSATLTPATLSQTIGIGLVQPGQRRTFALPIDLAAQITSVQATIDFNPKR